MSFGGNYPQQHPSPKKKTFVKLKGNTHSAKSTYQKGNIYTHIYMCVCFSLSLSPQKSQILTFFLFQRSCQIQQPWIIRIHVHSLYVWRCILGLFQHLPATATGEYRPLLTKVMHQTCRAREQTISRKVVEKRVIQSTGLGMRNNMIRLSYTYKAWLKMYSVDYPSHFKSTRLSTKI